MTNSVRDEKRPSIAPNTNYVCQRLRKCVTI